MERTSTVTVQLIGFSNGAEGFAALACRNCGVPLDLHQPGVEFPDRLLGTCEECGSWFLVDLTPDGQTGVVVHLPPSGFFFKASG